MLLLVDCLKGTAGAERVLADCGVRFLSRLSAAGADGFAEAEALQEEAPFRDESIELGLQSSDVLLKLSSLGSKQALELADEARIGQLRAAPIT